MPDAIGDFFTFGTIRLNSAFVGNAGLDPIEANGSFDVPLPGGRRVKISEHNKALPVDRCYFLYNHFENALGFESALRLQPFNAVVGTDFAQARSIDRYTFGMEKTFACGRSSLEVRLPLSGTPGLDEEEVAGDFGSLGNLALSLKCLLWLSDTESVVAGLGASLPTGDDGFLRIVDRTLTVQNRAVHLLPYVGILGRPNPRMFFHSFVQLDIDSNGNRIVDRVVDGNIVTVTTQRLTDPTLLFLDLSAGYWLFGGDDCDHEFPCGVTGLASVVELHMTTSLEDVESAQLGQGAMVGQRGNGKIQVANLTMGLHAELARCTSLRIAGVFPLRDGENRFFDSEFIVHISRRL